MSSETLTIIILGVTWATANTVVIYLTNRGVKFQVSELLRVAQLDQITWSWRDDVKGPLLDLKQKIDVADFDAKVGMDSTVESQPIGGWTPKGWEWKFCYLKVGGTVIHRVDCRRAPHMDRRADVWAYTEEEAALFAREADMRPCDICKPFAWPVKEAVDG